MSHGASSPSCSIFEAHLLTHRLVAASERRRIDQSRPGSRGVQLTRMARAYALPLTARGGRGNRAQRASRGNATTTTERRARARGAGHRSSNPRGADRSHPEAGRRTSATGARAVSDASAAHVRTGRRGDASRMHTHGRWRSLARRGRRCVTGCRERDDLTIASSGDRDAPAPAKKNPRIDRSAFPRSTPGTPAIPRESSSRRSACNSRVVYSSLAWEERSNFICTIYLPFVYGKHSYNINLYDFYNCHLYNLFNCTQVM